MSRETADIVRRPLAVKPTSHRRLEERLGLRFPRAVALAVRALWSLSPRSWLRRALIQRYLRFTYEAANRRDDDAQVLLFHPEGEAIVPPDLVALGFDRCYRGREERIRLQRRWTEEWGEHRLVPSDFIDLGDNRLLVLGQVRLSGLRSQVGLHDEWAEIFTISAGRAVREQLFLDHAEALEAAGLRE